MGAAGPHQRFPVGCCRGFLLSAGLTTTSLRNLSCGCLLIGRVTYRGEVCLVCNFQSTAAEHLSSFFPRVLFSSIHDSFDRSILFAARTKHAHSTTAPWRSLSAAPPCSPAPTPPSPSAPVHSILDRSTGCAESPPRNRGVSVKGIDSTNLIHAVILADGLPVRHPAVPRIVGSEGIRRLTVKLVPVSVSDIACPAGYSSQG